MTHYTNYDDYKLSNPEDDGHYIEDKKPRIESAIYFKYRHRNGKKYNYGMIGTSGHDIRVWDYGHIRTIEVDEIETYVDEVNSEIKRVNANYEDTQLIERGEFMAEFNEAQTKILNLVHDNENY